jgi:hypothetical protein
VYILTKHPQITKPVKTTTVQHTHQMKNETVTIHTDALSARVDPKVSRLMPPSAQQLY